MPQRTLQTERITLVPLADEHLEWEVELDSDPEVWVGFVDGDFVGWWTLQPAHGPDQPDAPDVADLGYRLLRRHWRRGLASEGRGSSCATASTMSGSTGSSPRRSPSTLARKP